MQRREFTGAMLAMFCGVAMPAPVIDQIQVIWVPPPELFDMNVMTRKLGERFMEPVLFGPSCVPGVVQGATEAEFKQWALEQTWPKDPTKESP